MSLQTEKYRQSTIDYIDKNWDLNRGFFISCHLNDQLGLDIVKVRKNVYKHLNTERNELFRRISKVNTQFYRSLEKYCFSKDSKRLEKLSVIEMKNRNHIHLIVETCEHLSKEQMKKNILLSHSDTKKLCDIKIKEIDYRRSLYKYLTKEQVDLNKDTLDIKNSFFKKLN